MDKPEIIKKTAEYIEKTFKNTHSGHDWWHMWRVWQNAKMTYPAASCEVSG